MSVLDVLKQEDPAMWIFSFIIAFTVYFLVRVAISFVWNGFSIFSANQVVFYHFDPSFASSSSPSNTNPNNTTLAANSIIDASFSSSASTSFVSEFSDFSSFGKFTVSNLVRQGLHKFKPTPFLRHTFLQTAWGAYFRNKGVSEVVYERSLISTPDGGTLSIDLVVDQQQQDDEDDDETRPILILLHGLTGGSSEDYIKQVILHAQKTATATTTPQKRFRIYAFNYRGCAFTPVTSPRSYSACSTDDLRAQLNELRARHPHCPYVCAIGFSLGSILLVNYLREEGSRSLIHVAVSVSNPFDMKLASRQLEAGPNRFFNKFLARRMVAFFFHKLNWRGDLQRIERERGNPFSKQVWKIVNTPPEKEDPYSTKNKVVADLHHTSAPTSPSSAFASLASGSDEGTYTSEHSHETTNRNLQGRSLFLTMSGGGGGGLDPELVASFDKIRDLDQAIIAPMYGFRDAWEYYEHSSSDATHIRAVCVPLLCINARDDMFCDPKGVPLEEFKRNPRTVLCWSREGGHIGFEEGWMPTGTNWADRVAIAFIRSTLFYLDQQQQKK